MLYWSDISDCIIVRYSCAVLERPLGLYKQVCCGLALVVVPHLLPVSSVALEKTSDCATTSEVTPHDRNHVRTVNITGFKMTPTQCNNCVPTCNLSYHVWMFFLCTTFQKSYLITRYALPYPHSCSFNCIPLSCHNYTSSIHAFKYYFVIHAR